MTTLRTEIITPGGSIQINETKEAVADSWCQDGNVILLIGEVREVPLVINNEEE